MKRAAPRFAALAVPVAIALACAVSCQLVIGLDGLDNQQCPSGQKGCNGHCVSTSDPAYGCGRLDDCAPCVLLNASARCDNNGQCAVSGCVGDYLNCSESDQSGCEIDSAHDPLNCGGCTIICMKPAQGIAGCSAKQCAVGGCDDGFEDCNHVYSDGCETDLQNDDQNCGTCGYACKPAESCQLGVCVTNDGGVGD